MKVYSDRPVEVIVLGCGSRGRTYADWCYRHPTEAKVVAVAEPDDVWRARMQEKYNLPAERCFRSWEDVAKLPKFADVVFVCTMDAMHLEPAVAFADMGYDMLLEKPMAPDEESCRKIHAALKRNDTTVAVCHVLRYTEYTRRMKEIIDSGELGDIVSVQHLEPVGHFHQAHSFVRGNWRNTAESSCMLLQKCCHDLDWLRYIIGKHCQKVQSFGDLYEFRKERQPKGAADRCTSCPPEVESQCPYSAISIYIRNCYDKSGYAWPENVITTDPTREGAFKALREGPYGRCVYACDNDVVDHQVVNMLFDDGLTAQHTMTAFCNEGGRQTRIFGTRGSITTLSDGGKFRVTNFLTGQSRVIDPDVVDDGTIASGHGGGDERIMDAFIGALRTGDKSKILSNADETLESHLMVFRAERSRLENKIIDIE